MSGLPPLLQYLADRFILGPAIQEMQKRAFPLRLEMQQWARQPPTPSVHTLVERGMAWVLKKYDTSLDDAELTARLAFIDLAKGHPAVSPAERMIARSVATRLETENITGNATRTLAVINYTFESCKLLVDAYDRRQK